MNMRKFPHPRIIGLRLQTWTYWGGGANILSPIIILVFIIYINFKFNFLSYFQDQVTRWAPPQKKKSFFYPSLPRVPIIINITLYQEQNPLYLTLHGTYSIFHYQSKDLEIHSFHEKMKREYDQNPSGFSIRTHKVLHQCHYFPPYVGHLDMI